MKFEWKVINNICLSDHYPIVWSYISSTPIIPPNLKVIISAKKFDKNIKDDNLWRTHDLENNQTYEAFETFTKSAIANAEITTREKSDEPKNVQRNLQK
jgi:hypothetical protein